MPFEPTNPETKKIAGPQVDQAMTTIAILNLNIVPQGPLVEFLLGEGYVDAASVFQVVSTRKVTVPNTAEYGEDGGLAILGAEYATIKDAAYRVLIALGELPPGQVV